MRIELHAFLLDGENALLGSPLEVATDTKEHFGLRRRLHLETLIESPVVLMGEPSGEPERLTLEACEWNSGKTGFRGAVRTEWGYLRVNITAFSRKERVYGFDLRLDRDEPKKSVPAAVALPPSWLAANSESAAKGARA